MIPVIGQSGKNRTIKRVKRSVVANVKGRGGLNR